MKNSQAEFEVFLENYFKDDCYAIKELIQNKTPSGQYRDISVRWMLSSFLASRGELNPLREARHDFSSDAVERGSLKLESIARENKDEK